MLADGVSSLPATCTGRPSRSSTRCATLTAVAGTSTSSSRITNSSPDRRATRSGSRTQACRRRRDGLEHLVAGEVAEAVVDDLEAVDVEVQQRALAMRLVLGARQHAVEAAAQVAAVGQAGQGVVHDLVLELVLDALALADFRAQLLGARLHALLELGERLLLDPRGAAAVEAVGDLRGDEAEQLLVGRPVHHRGVVALHRDQPERLVAEHQRHAEPARRRRAGRRRARSRSRPRRPAAGPARRR